MTREEQIRQKAISEQRELMESCDWRAGFIAGAKLADKTMIDKACEWLSKTLYIHTESIEDKHWNKIETFDWVTSDYNSVSDFIDGFRKAMEVGED